MISCGECPKCKDVYPGMLDPFGNHFHVCKDGGNMVYTEPRKEKRCSGKGYAYYPASSCGIYETIEDAKKA